MSHRVFTLADQMAFAELSGDNNPLHIDPVAARRSLFGQPVVHGVHSLMWALDQWLRGQGGFVRLERLHAAFVKPVGLHQELHCRLVSEAGPRVRMDLLQHDEVAVRLAFECAAFEPGPAADVDADPPAQQPPDALTLDELRAGQGTLELHWPPALAGRLFPNLARRFCPRQAAVLLGLTRLVGVKCPGLHSIFSELRLAAEATGDQRSITYSVAELNERYRQVSMGVTAPGLRGSVKAFIRPPPQAQASFLELKQRVKEGEFAGQRALVVGGSRGLGEVTAKLLAAGGAQMQITYQRGRTDAEQVVAEILAGGGQASLGELDVLQPQTAPAGLTPPTHLYYFASPFIAASAKRGFSPAVFQTFCNYYVSGFAGVVEALQPLGLQQVFYPSTVFLDELPAGFVEYAVAKSAGEALCRALGKKHPGMSFYSPRLPKLATDQTASLQPVQSPDPAPVILDALRRFRDGQDTTRSAACS